MCTHIRTHIRTHRRTGNSGSCVHI
jgi:hypothetical protein